MKRLICLLLIALATAAKATVYNSDGSDVGTSLSVQTLHDAATDGDTITLPAGSFGWVTGVKLTKGVTISGQTVINGTGWNGVSGGYPCGPAANGSTPCTYNDQTIIVDKMPRSSAGGLVTANIPPGKPMFRN